MTDRREEIRGWFYRVVEIFRQKGALNLEKAMSPEELGLPPMFENAMKGRLGRTGVFVEVSGKYFLSEERLKQVEELRPVSQTAIEFRKRIMRLRMVQLVIAAVFVALFAVNLFFQSFELRVVSIMFLVIWLAMSVFQIYYLSRIRRKIQGTQSAVDSSSKAGNNS